jgi:hypothetical protein
MILDVNYIMLDADILRTRQKNIFGNFLCSSHYTDQLSIFSAKACVDSVLKQNKLYAGKLL